MLDHLQHMQYLSQVLNACGKQNSWLVFRAPNPDPQLKDRWVGSFSYKGCHLIMLGEWGFKYKECVAFLPLPSKIRGAFNGQYPHATHQVDFNITELRNFDDRVEMVKFLQSRINLGYIPYAFQYLTDNKPTDTLSRKVDKLLWTKDTCTALDVNKDCVFKLPSIEETYQLGFPVELQDWYYTNRDKLNK